MQEKSNSYEPPAINFHPQETSTRERKGRGQYNRRLCPLHSPLGTRINDAVGLFAYARCVTAIISGSRGRSVNLCCGQTDWPGASASRKFFMIVASTSVASCRAKPAPMHMRGPMPKGR